MDGDETILTPTTHAARTKSCRSTRKVLRARGISLLRPRARMATLGLLGIVILSMFFTACSGGACGTAVSLLGECKVSPYYVGGKKARVRSAAPFEARAGHTSLVFGGKIWVIGGNGTGPAGTDVYHNDVWFSENGKDWVWAVADMDAAALAASSTKRFTPRTEHTSVVFDGKMWVIGGRGVDAAGNPEYYNDVWSSADGTAWVKETNAPFVARAGHASVVFGKTIWVIGGEVKVGNSTTTFSSAEVWNSADGKNWMQTLRDADSPYPVRSSHASAVYQNKLWIIGGHRNDGINNVLLNDVWSSPDGINWKKEKSSARFSARGGHAALEFAELLMVIGGRAGAAGPDLGDMWVMRNDGTWAESPASIVPRSGHSAVVFDHKLFVIGGVDGDVFYNDVWSVE